MPAFRRLGTRHDRPGMTSPTVAPLTPSDSSMPRRFFVRLVFLAPLACGGDPVAPPEASYTIAIHGGSPQQGPAGSILEQPLQVTVSNVANQPVQGVVVRFRE